MSIWGKAHNKSQPPMQINSKITSIVVNWNLKEITARCIESLEQSHTPSRTIIVDNGSKDGSVPYLRRRYPQAEVIALGTNLGFGSACNIAIRQALQDPQCEYVFLLNNDAALGVEALSVLLRTAEENPGVGILGPKIYYQHAARKIWYAGSQRRRFVLAAKVPGRDKLDQGQFDQSLDVDYVFGAGMFIRRQVLERVGLFDERYFLYLEDLDLCLRAQKAGFSLVYVPQSCLWHIGSASSAQNPALRRYHHARSTMLFLAKHLAPLSIPAALIFWTAVCLKMIGRDLIDGNPHLMRSYLSALKDSIRLRRSSLHRENPGGTMTSSI